MEDDLYINLIYKQLSNAITPAELKQLREWRAESPENEQLAADIAETWDKSAELAAVPEVDLDAEFSFLEARIQADAGPVLVDEPEEKGVGIPVANLALNRKPSYWFKWGGIAAGIAALIIVGILVYPMLQSGVEMEWAEVNTSKQRIKVELPDGSAVTLKEDSHLKYPKNMAATQRTVKLVGEAFFEIEPNPERPFKVDLSGSEVTVLGTSFLVKNRSEDKTTEVHVATGKVRFSIDESKEVILVKGQGGVCDRKTKSIEQMEAPSVNSYAWFSKRLEFKKTPLAEAEELIEEYYEIALTLNGAGHEKCTLSGSFDLKTVEELLGSIALILGGELEKTGAKEYKITGLEC